MSTSCLGAKNLDRISQDEIEKHYFKQYPGVAYAVKESNKHFWVKDDEHPYETVEGTEYDWLRVIILLADQ